VRAAHASSERRHALGHGMVGGERIELKDPVTKELSFQRVTSPQMVPCVPVAWTDGKRRIEGGPVDTRRVPLTFGR
jgi:hypothetical protein